MDWWGWYLRNVFLSPSNKVSRLSGSLPVVSGVLVCNSLIINDVSFSGNGEFSGSSEGFSERERE